MKVIYSTMDRFQLVYIRSPDLYNKTWHSLCLKLSDRPTKISRLSNSRSFSSRNYKTNFVSSKQKIRSFRFDEKIQSFEIT